MSDRYEPVRRHGLVMVWDDLNRWAHSFPSTFEEAEAEANRLNREEEAKAQDESLLVALPVKSERVRGTAL